MRIGGGVLPSDVVNAPCLSPCPLVTSSSRPSSSSTPSCTSSSPVVSPSGPGAKYEAGARFVFIELFAGKGALSHAVGKYVATLPPQDLESGGTYFLIGQPFSFCGHSGRSYQKRDFL